MNRLRRRDRCEVNWIEDIPGADPARGMVQWDPVHSLWNGGMLAASLLLVPFFTTPSAVTVGLALTGAMLLLGHSVGFHRLLIHGSFETTPWLRALLIWCGTVAGMSGPIWIVQTHDLRDWAQRQTNCHDYLAHRRPMIIDAWWQLHCTLKLESPPRFDLARLEESRFIRWLERTWMLQQLPVAALLYWAGGWPFVVWGVFVRVALTVRGHWLIGHLAHRRGPQSWEVRGAGVQAHDVPWAGLITMGEAWHNNHHAFPGSARIGLKPGQSDWGYIFIQLLEKLGLAWNVCLPQHMLGRESKLRVVGEPATPRPQQPTRRRSQGPAGSHRNDGADHPPLGKRSPVHTECVPYAAKDVDCCDIRQLCATVSRKLNHCEQNQHKGCAFNEVCMRAHPADNRFAIFMPNKDLLCAAHLAHSHHQPDVEDRCSRGRRECYGK